MNEVIDYTAANNAFPKIPLQYSKFPFETIFFSHQNQKDLFKISDLSCYSYSINLLLPSHCLKKNKT